MKWTNPGHQLDHLGERYLKVKNLYIFGVDEKAGNAYKLLQWLGVADEFNISFVLDITVINQGADRTFCGKPVIPFQTELCDALRAAPEECAVALPWIAQTAERAIMEELGADNIFYLLGSNNRRDNFVQNFVCVWLMYKHGKLLSHWTNFVTTSKCNLNCKHCLNFNEYITCPQDVPFDSFKAHIDAVFSKFDYLYSLHFTGGESLLVKELPRFIRYVQEAYGERIFDFFVITNGTVVPSEETFEAVKSMNGAFLVDDYSDSVSTTKVEAIKSACGAHGVGCTVNKADFWFDLDLENADYSGCTEEELERHKDSCNTFLHEIADGKIYACCYEEYANRVGIGTPDPSDSIDIAGASKMEILEFRQGYTRKGYVELCKHCRGIGDDSKKAAAAIQIPRAPGKMPSDASRPADGAEGLVSICVPIYNTGKYLARCIKSLLAQTYQRLEIVLVDDGSTDQSGLICDEYAALDSRVVVVHKQNGGEASARNAGLRAANGTYVMFIDSDDEYLPNAVRLMVDEMAKKGADLVVGGYLERNGDVERFATGHIRAYTAQEIARSYLTSECVYSMPYIATTVNGKLFRREIISCHCISFDERFVIGNDSVFMCEYLKHTKMIYDIFAPIYVYYKYQPAERVQGMNWYYPDGFFLFAYVADRMIKMVRPDEAEWKQLAVKQYKDFFYAAVNAAANADRFPDGLLPYFTSLCSEIDFLQAAAKLDLIENVIAKEEGALPFRLISYLLVKQRYEELCELLHALSKMRNMVPFQGERVRQMLQLDNKQSDTDKIPTAPEYEPQFSAEIHFVDDKLLVGQIDELAAAVISSQRRIEGYEEKVGQMAAAGDRLEAQAAQAEARAIDAEAKAAQAEARAGQAEARAIDAEAGAGQAEARAIDAEARAAQAEDRDRYHQAMIEEYVNSTSWRITEPLRKLMRCFRKGS